MAGGLRWTHCFMVFYLRNLRYGSYLSPQRGDAFSAETPYNALPHSPSTAGHYHAVIRKGLDGHRYTVVRKLACGHRSSTGLPEGNPGPRSPPSDPRSSQGPNTCAVKIYTVSASKRAETEEVPILQLVSGPHREGTPDVYHHFWEESPTESNSQRNGYKPEEMYDYYSAPETLLSNPSCSPATDIWMLGYMDCVPLWEALVKALHGSDVAEAASFIKACMRMNPEERLSAKELAKHKWLSCANACECCYGDGSSTSAFEKSPVALLG
ncbi:hypothetical protein BKA70DRAFT_1447972 [Coprinopsis sp. MPI-PUGE-AT-0042]|nr:hypothetical protein BKA70DRAFT_1447972 [Coprinopsis sp. MPI-PUGE-AT-0042]